MYRLLVGPCHTEQEECVEALVARLGSVEPRWWKSVVRMVERHVLPDFEAVQQLGALCEQVEELLGPGGEAVATSHENLRALRASMLSRYPRLHEARGTADGKREGVSLLDLLDPDVVDAEDVVANSAYCLGGTEVMNQLDRALRLVSHVEVIDPYAFSKGQEASLVAMLKSMMDRGVSQVDVYGYVCLDGYTSNEKRRTGAPQETDLDYVQRIKESLTRSVGAKLRIGERVGAQDLECVFHLVVVKDRHARSVHDRALLLLGENGDGAMDGALTIGIGRGVFAFGQSPRKFQPDGSGTLLGKHRPGHFRDLRDGMLNGGRHERLVLPLKSAGPSP